MFVQLVVVLLGVWMPLVRCQAGSECIEDRTQAISVVLNGARNLTGDWISQVVLRRSEEQSSTAQTHTWSVQVEPTTFKCGADKTALEVSLTFIGQSFKPSDLQNFRATGINSGPDVLLPPRQLPSMTIRHIRGRAAEDPPTTLRISASGTTPAPPGFSRADYELVPGQGHYKFHITPVSWLEARDACAAEGSHLMILDSMAEVEVFKKLFARQATTITGADDSTWAWLGVHRPLLGGSLNITGYSRWYSGGPKEAGYDYVLGYRNSGEFHDNPIWAKFPFICEHQL